MNKTLFAVILSTLPVFAQQESPMTKEIPAPAPGMEQPRHWGAAGEMPGRAERKDFHKKMLERFDADQDGQLSDAEKEAMKAEMKKNHEGKRPGHGTRGERDPKGPRGERGDRPAMPAEMMDKFDADKDGQLSDAEKEAMKAEMKKNHEGKRPGHGTCGERGPKGPRGERGDRPAMPAEMMDKFDADKDGQLCDEERGDRPAMPAEMMDKFDADKDGQLSDAEREAAKAARPQHPRHHGKGHGKRGERGPKGPRGPQAPEDAANVPVTLPL